MPNSLPIAPGITLEAMGDCWVRPAFHHDLFQIYLCCLIIGLCKAGRGLFGGRILNGRPALRQAGRTLLLNDQFQYSHQMFGLRFSSNLG